MPLGLRCSILAKLVFIFYSTSFFIFYSVSPSDIYEPCERTDPSLISLPSSESSKLGYLLAWPSWLDSWIPSWALSQYLSTIMLITSSSWSAYIVVLLVLLGLINTTVDLACCPFILSMNASFLRFFSFISTTASFSDISSSFSIEFCYLYLSNYGSMSRVTLSLLYSICFIYWFILSYRVLWASETPPYTSLPKLVEPGLFSLWNPLRIGLDDISPECLLYSMFLVLSLSIRTLFL